MRGAGRRPRTVFVRVGLPLCVGLAALGLQYPAAATSAASHDGKVLDFLADWQGSDGQWVDPMTFARIDPAKVKAEDARRHGVPAAGSGPAPAPATSAPATTLAAGKER